MLDRTGIFGDFAVGSVDKVNSLVITFGDNNLDISDRHLDLLLSNHHTLHLENNITALVEELTKAFEEEQWQSITLVHTGTEDNNDFIEALEEVLKLKMKKRNTTPLTIIDLISDAYDAEPLFLKFRSDQLNGLKLEPPTLIKMDTKCYSVKFELTGRPNRDSLTAKVVQLMRNIRQLTYKELAYFDLCYNVKEDTIEMYRISEGEPRYEVHIEPDTLKPLINYHNNLKSLDGKHRFNEYPALAELANKYFPNPIAVTVEVDSVHGVIKNLTARTKTKVVKERIREADDFLKLLTIAREGSKHITLITETEEEKHALDDLYKESSADAPLSFYTYCDILRYYFKNLAPVLGNYDIEFSLEELRTIYSTKLNPIVRVPEDELLQTIVTEIYGNTPTKEYIKVRYLDSRLLKSLEDKISEEDYLALRSLTREYELYVELLYNQYKYGK